MTQSLSILAFAEKAERHARQKFYIFYPFSTQVHLSVLTIKLHPADKIIFLELYEAIVQSDKNADELSLGGKSSNISGYILEDT